MLRFIALVSLLVAVQCELPSGLRTQLGDILKAQAQNVAADPAPTSSTLVNTICVVQIPTITLNTDLTVSGKVPGKPTVLSATGTITEGTTVTPCTTCEYQFAVRPTGTPSGSGSVGEIQDTPSTAPVTSDDFDGDFDVTSARRFHVTSYTEKAENSEYESLIKKITAHVQAVNFDESLPLPTESDSQDEAPTNRYFDALSLLGSNRPFGPTPPSTTNSASFILCFPSTSYIAAVRVIYKQQVGSGSWYYRYRTKAQTFTTEAYGTLSTVNPTSTTVFPLDLAGVWTGSPIDGTYYKLSWTADPTVTLLNPLTLLTTIPTLPSPGQYLFKLTLSSPTCPNLYREERRSITFVPAIPVVTLNTVTCPTVGSPMTFTATANFGGQPCVGCQYRFHARASSETHGFDKPANCGDYDGTGNYLGPILGALFADDKQDWSTSNTFTFTSCFPTLNYVIMVKVRSGTVYSEPAYSLFQTSQIPLASIENWIGNQDPNKRLIVTGKIDQNTTIPEGYTTSWTITPSVAYQATPIPTAIQFPVLSTPATSYKAVFVARSTKCPLIGTIDTSTIYYQTPPQYVGGNRNGNGLSLTCGTPCCANGVPSTSASGYVSPASANWKLTLDAISYENKKVTFEYTVKVTSSSNKAKSVIFLAPCACSDSPKYKLRLGSDNNNNQQATDNISGLPGYKVTSDVSNTATLTLTAERPSNIHSLNSPWGKEAIAVADIPFAILGANGWTIHYVSGPVFSAPCGATAVSMSSVFYATAFSWNDASKYSLSYTPQTSSSVASPLSTYSTDKVISVTAPVVAASTKVNFNLNVLDAQGAFASVESEEFTITPATSAAIAAWLTGAIGRLSISPTPQLIGEVASNSAASHCATILPVIAAISSTDNQMVLAKAQATAKCATTLQAAAQLSSALITHVITVATAVLADPTDSAVASAQASLMTALSGTPTADQTAQTMTVLNGIATAAADIMLPGETALVTTPTYTQFIKVATAATSTGNFLTSDSVGVVLPTTFPATLSLGNTISVAYISTILTGASATNLHPSATVLHSGVLRISLFNMNDNVAIDLNSLATVASGSFIKIKPPVSGTVTGDCSYWSTVSNSWVVVGTYSSTDGCSTNRLLPSSTSLHKFLTQAAQGQVDWAVTKPQPASGAALSANISDKTIKKSIIALIVVLVVVGVLAIVGAIVFFLWRRRQRSQVGSVLRKKSAAYEETGSPTVTVFSQKETTPRKDPQTVEVKQAVEEV